MPKSPQRIIFIGFDVPLTWSSGRRGGSWFGVEEKWGKWRENGGKLPLRVPWPGNLRTVGNPPFE